MFAREHRAVLLRTARFHEECSPGGPREQTVRPGGPGSGASAPLVLYQITPPPPCKTAALRVYTRGIGFAPNRCFNLNISSYDSTFRGGKKEKCLQWLTPELVMKKYN